MFSKKISSNIIYTYKIYRKEIVTKFTWKEKIRSQSTNTKKLFNKNIIFKLAQTYLLAAIHILLYL